MTEYAPGAIAEAFNSMLRTDYISLNDTEKLFCLVHIIQQLANTGYAA